MQVEDRKLCEKRQRTICELKGRPICERRSGENRSGGRRGETTNGITRGPLLPKGAPPLPRVALPSSLGWQCGKRGAEKRGILTTGKQVAGRRAVVGPAGSVVVKRNAVEPISRLQGPTKKGGILSGLVEAGAPLRVLCSVPAVPQTTGERKVVGSSRGILRHRPRLRLLSLRTPRERSRNEADWMLRNRKIPSKEVSDGGKKKRGKRRRKRNVIGIWLSRERRRAIGGRVAEIGEDNSFVGKPKEFESFPHSAPGDRRRLANVHEAPSGPTEM